MTRGGTPLARARRPGDTPAMLRAEVPDIALFGATARYGDLGIHAVIDLTRRFSRAALEAAMQATIESFPVLGRRYVPGFWRDAWHPVDGPLSGAVHVLEEPDDLDAETDRWARRPIDSARERPLRLVSFARGGGSRLILSITHLAVDGAGVAAVGHVLGAHLYGTQPSAPVDPRRSVASALEGLRWYHLPVLMRDLAASAWLPLRTWRAAPREREYPRAPSSEACWRHVTISSEDVARIGARCRPLGASVNDVLIAALAGVAARRSSKGPLAVMYTMDLRRYAGEPRLTAANTSSILLVNVPRSATSDLTTSVAAVAARTRRQRRGFAGPALLLAPVVLGWAMPHALTRRVLRWLHPVLIDMPLRRGVIYTNVGRIDHGLAAFGDDIEGLRIIGPSVLNVRTPSVVAFGFRGELHLALFGPPGLAPEALEELERELREALGIGQTQP